MYYVFTFGNFCTLPNSAQIPDSSNFVQRQAFSAHFFHAALYTPCACAAVFDGHGDQLLRTLHPNTSITALYAQLQCGFCNLPSQSQGHTHHSVHQAEGSCLFEVVFTHYSVCAQFRPYFHDQVVLFSNVCRWWVNIRRPMCTQAEMLVPHLFGSCLRIYSPPALVHKNGVLCIIFTVAIPAPSNGLHQPHLM